MKSTRLDPILDAVRVRAAERRRTKPLERLEQIVAQDLYRRERVLDAFAGPGFKLIAECKRRSPSAGRLTHLPGGEREPALRRSEDHDWFERAEAYARGGAAAISVLTEEDHFGGRLEDLRTVEHVQIPRLRKDFLLDEGMVYETMPYGADMVLLLPAILEPAKLRALRVLAGELGLGVLIEAHDEAELEFGLELEPELLGINARDLTTFEVDLRTVERLLPMIPEGPIKVAESGVGTLDDLKRVRDAGADAALVGTTLMRAPDPAATLASWKAALDG